MKPIKEKLPVVSYAETLPSRMLTAEEFSEALFDKSGVTLSAARITELADAFYIPHYRVDGGPPLFSFQEAKKWIAINLTERINGQDLPIECRVIISALPGNNSLVAPRVLSQIADRLIYHPLPIAISGVYFLCRGQDVVYVGQALSSGFRIATHVTEQRKDFDSAWILPCPPDQLDALEAAFIRALQPSHNKITPSAVIAGNVWNEIMRCTTENTGVELTSD